MAENEFAIDQCHTHAFCDQSLALSTKGHARRFRRYEGDPVAGSTLHHIGMIMTLDESNQIIVNAFKNNKFGVSPTSTRGAVQNFSKKHGLEGAEFTEALASAIASGLIAPMADSALTIRNAGRAMLPAR
ncbi:hypothetical protein [Rhizobium sp. Leaf321]|jgi:hypothetical protein|nr:hypothetical protein [Rhizobium sp. Leaf321]